MCTFFPASQARDLWYPKKAFPTSSGLRFTFMMIEKITKRMIKRMLEMMINRFKGDVSTISKNK